MYTKIIDISQPVSSSSACFPGDAPFRRQITLTFEQSGVVNLCSFSMSPHVGTHADAPVHIKGAMSDKRGMAADLPLDAFIGPVRVIDLAPCSEGITSRQFLDRIEGTASSSPLPPRILFKTCHQIRYHVFEDAYAHLTVDLVDTLQQRGVRLVGIDTPSVDRVDSKELESHHKLDEYKMVWLENLDLTEVAAGDYTLVALPLKLTEMEASPVRAVLLSD